ncbi:MAG TPA: cation:proton antiporter [Blastocatellia bacterium]|nr:cation:proton antiporter [Blastocatellia bacterium]
MSESEVIAAAVNIVFAMLGIAMILAFIRLARGPSLPDRVVALDLIAAIAVAITSVYAIATGQEALLDVAIVVALISFLGTVAFAQYLERRSRDE